MLVTLSGLPGSGTSTVARAASAALGIEHVDGGTIFRAMAVEHGLSLAEFAAQAEGDPSFDRDLDDRLLARARQGDVLLESRLAGWLAHRGDVGGLTVWIACDDAERARRVGGRDGQDLAEAIETNRVREASERARYLAYYDIDLADLSIYDLVLDSTDRTPEDLVAEILSAAANQTAATPAT